MGKIASIDLGVEHLSVGLVDAATQRMKVVYRERGNDPGFMRRVFKVLDGAGRLDGIGISSPGTIDMNKGIILGCPNLKIRNLPIVERMRDRYGVPVSLLNDAIAGVMGEKFYGAGREESNIAHIKFGSGIGCGVIADNRVLLGKDGNAHEVGHYVINPFSTLKCSCGKFGHWEAYCSGRGIPNFVKYMLNGKYSHARSSLRQKKQLVAKDLFTAAKKRDKVALDVLKVVGMINAMGIANVINSYDPELITIGNSVVLENEDAILRPIIKDVGKYTVNRVPKIIVTPLDYRLSLYGAVSDFL
ncbi:MAG: ROK family protein [Candidatus Micrarchaeota archaeon]|nr:ROK family protein [Candidatus Micrarchaeota archaeon]